MAVLETIRVKFGVLITVLIALALLSFIVDFNSLSSALNSTSSKYAVGKIDGKKIPYKDFQEQVEYQTKIAELVSGNQASSEQGQQQIRQASWQHFVDQNLFLKNASAAGIEVGKDEIFALTTGELDSPVMQYSPVFAGNVNIEAVQAFTSGIDEDQSGNSRLYWDYLQHQVAVQQYYAKYASLFTASSLFNNVTMQNTLLENNTTSTVEAVTVNFPFQKDSTITVSSSEIKKYYSSHKEEYKQKANRDIVYALFEVEPSEDDFSAAEEALEEVYDEFAGASNVKNFLMRNSDQALANYYYKEGELRSISPEIDDFVFSGKKGVSPIIKADESYYAVKVVDTKSLPERVFVRHILVDSDSLANVVLSQLRKNPSEFTSLAIEYSYDHNPNVAQPGDLGWMNQSNMIPGMESVLEAAVNKPFILNTRYGVHVVLVTERVDVATRKQVAFLKKTAVPSKATMNKFYSKANELASSAAGKLEKLEAAAKEQGVYLRPMNINEGTSNYASVSRAKEVTRWAFEAKKGEVSNVITVNQNYLFVVGVKESHKEGYKKVEEVKAGIESILYSQKLADKVAAEVASKIEGCTTMEEVGAALDQTPYTAENVSFAAMGGEYEPAFIGAASSAEQGKIAGPVKGSRGVYVLQVKERTEGSHFTEEDAKAQAAQKVQYESQMIVPVMLEQTGSVDNRERFY